MGKIYLGVNMEFVRHHDKSCEWGQRVIDIVHTAPRDIVFSVECGTVPEAERSFAYLSKLI